MDVSTGGRIFLSHAVAARIPEGLDFLLAGFSLQGGFNHLFRKLTGRHVDYGLLQRSIEEDRFRSPRFIGPGHPDG